MLRHLLCVGLTMVGLAGCQALPPSRGTVATEVAHVLADLATQTASAPTVPPTYTPYATHTPYPTYTLPPTQTPLPTHTAPPSATPPLRETQTPTTTRDATPLPSTSTPLPVATPVPQPLYAEPHGVLAFQINRGTYDNDLYLVNVNGSGLRLVMKDAGLPSFSRDGREIMFYKWNEGVDMMGLDGSNRRRIVHDNQGAHAHIGADGYSVLYNTGTVNWERWQWDLKICVIGLDGKRFRTIIEGWQPAWHPSEMRFVCKTCDGNTCGLFVMNADGSGRRMISNNPDDQHPSWSPDGGRIAFTSSRDGNWEVYVMNADGSAPRRLTNSLTTDALPV